MPQQLCTKQQIATSKHSVGTELYYCLVTGEPAIVRIDLAKARTCAISDLEHGLGGDVSIATRSIYVGKGAHRAAKRALRREEMRLNIADVK